MEEALKCTIKFCRVTGIPLDLREYDGEELMSAIAVICEETSGHDWTPRRIRTKKR